MKCVLHAPRAQALTPPPLNSGGDVHRRFLLSRSSTLFLNPNFSSSNRSSSFLGFSSPPISTRSAACSAASPGSPSPQSDDSPSGLDSIFSKFQDKVQIFFAVLFWMSLFFWTCAWDGRNGGRPTKRSRFRR